LIRSKNFEYALYPFRKYWDQGWKQPFLMKKSLFLVFFYEIMINFDKSNRQLLLTGCKLNCFLTWFGSCCLKRIMKTGQTWPYRKDRDDCNDRVTPNSPKNLCFPNKQALEPCHNSPVTIFAKIDIFSQIKGMRVVGKGSWKEREVWKF